MNKKQRKKEREEWHSFWALLLVSTICVFLFSCCSTKKVVYLQHTGYWYLKDVEQLNCQNHGKCRYDMYWRGTNQPAGYDTTFNIYKDTIIYHYEK